MIYVSASTETASSSPSAAEVKPVSSGTGRRICILVLGMHRSGTSMVARMLNLLGATLPRNIIPPDANNLAGYWEPAPLNTLNDKMLVEAGSRWDDWRPLDLASVPPARHEYYRAEVSRLIEYEFGDAPLFVLKEPRISRFVPLYADVLESMGIDVRYVLATRNPLEVIASLESRDGLTPSFGALLWLRHVLDAEYATRGKPRVVVSYDAMIDSWGPELDRMARIFGMQWPRSADIAHAEMDAFVSSRHRHHEANQTSPIDDDRAILWAKEVYAALAEEASEPRALATLDAVKTDFDNAGAVIGTAFFNEVTAARKKLAEKLAETDQQAAELAAERLEEHREFERLTDLHATEVRQLGQHIEELTNQVARRERKIERAAATSQQTNSKLREVQGQLARARMDLLRSQADIVAIRQSASWRVSAPLRGVKVALSAALRRLSPFAHSIWRCLPLSSDQRRRAKNLLFGMAPSVFSLTATYRNWRISRAATSPTIDRNSSFVSKLDAPPLIQKSARLVCFYLPQFHAIAENDQWWGKDFTEWTNVRPAEPLFEGHYQPHIPGHELGYYDLTEPEVQKKQVALAKTYGIEGFCFYFYWFGGKRLLESPTENYLNNPDLDLPFCLCWANENWTRRWDGLDSEVLIGQNHSAEDDLAFIAYVSKYLRDPRYIRVEGKPLLLVYRPSLLPSAKRTADQWRNWCRENGIGEIFLAYTQSFEAVDPKQYGFDGAVEFPPNNSAVPDLTGSIAPASADYNGTVYDWDTLVQRSETYTTPGYSLFRAVCPSWDNTPRRKSRATTFLNNTPERFGQWLRNAIDDTGDRFVDPSKRLVFINAWNEWAEGAHLEPDTRDGYAYLQATRMALARTARHRGKVPAVATRDVSLRTAIAIHAYYPEVLEEILDFVGNMEPLHKLFVTTDADHLADVRRRLDRVDNPAQLTVCENRGRDILPFFQSYRLIREEQYDLIIKVHTKRSLHRVDGDAWRYDLYRQLLNPDAINNLVDRFAHDDDLGMIGPSGHYVSMETYLGSNEARILRFGRQMGLSEPEILNRGFFAGTMFIARTMALEPMMSLAIPREQFEAEAGQVDGTLAHALERIFALSAYAAGFRIDEVEHVALKDDPWPTSPMNQYRHA